MKPSSVWTGILHLQGCHSATWNVPALNAALTTWLYRTLCVWIEVELNIFLPFLLLVWCNVLALAWLGVSGLHWADNPAGILLDFPPPVLECSLMWTQRQDAIARSAAVQYSLKFCHRLDKVEWGASRRERDRGGGSGLTAGFRPGISYDSWWVGETQGGSRGSTQRPGEPWEWYQVILSWPSASWRPRISKDRLHLTIISDSKLIS